MSSYPNGRNNPEIFKGSLKANVLITDSEYQKRFISNLFQGKNGYSQSIFLKKSFFDSKITFGRGSFLKIYNDVPKYFCGLSGKMLDSQKSWV